MGRKHFGKEIDTMESKYDLFERVLGGTIPLTAFLRKTQLSEQSSRESILVAVENVLELMAGCDDVATQWTKVVLEDYRTWLQQQAGEA